ncbi:hypothetical protein FSZ31_06200 [Sphingorhabdus soli]|uniref:DUF3106 domain-containing protein n=1 Tax=Flavisphingopyxis soli TaxID=2601267 RepID=A0A5C6UQ46_9SPHN|nr:hypothetical protein [Sphingorhabdus soli]TXC74286.1 hypothetical protein FSZ31_06200 [Sphingorhabdus soli]
MKHLMIAAAMMCTPAALIAQDMGDMDMHDETIVMTPEQQALYDAWPAERQSAFDGWPNDYRVYYWTLQPDQQNAYWVLTNDQRMKVAAMPDAQRAAVWNQIMAQYKANAANTGKRVEHPGMAGMTPAGNPASSEGHAMAGPMTSTTAPAPATLPYCSASVTDNCMQKNEAPRGYKPTK